MNNLNELVNTFLDKLRENGFQDKEILSVVLDNLVIEESFKKQIIEEKEFKKEYFSKLSNLLNSKKKLELSLHDLMFIIRILYFIHIHNYKTTDDFIEQLSEELNIKKDRLKEELFGRWFKVEKSMKKVIENFGKEEEYLKIWERSLDYFKKQYLEKLEKVIYEQANINNL